MATPLSVTLSLLQGPTKAAVATAVGAGVGTSLFAASCNPALCFTYREPYDDTVFDAARTGDGDVQAAADLTKSAWKARKPLRPIGHEALSRLVGTRNILLTAFRNVSVSTILAVNRYFAQLLEAEDAAYELNQDVTYPPFPWQEFSRASTAGLVFACVDWATQFVRIIVDWYAALKLPASLSRRLRKDLRASVLRKASYPFYIRVPRVIRTALFSEATFFAADWMTNCVLECYNAAYKMPSYATKEQRLRRLGLRCCLQGLRCCSLLFASSIGCGAGSMLPERIRPVGMLITMQATCVLVNMYANAFIARLTGAAPPSLPPPAAGPPIPGPQPPPGGGPAPPPPHEQQDLEEEEGEGGEDFGFIAPEGEDLLQAAEDAGEDVVQQLAGPPPAPLAVEPQDGRLGGDRGPRLPPRRPRGNGGGAAIAAPGPGTPQAPREPRLPPPPVDAQAADVGVAEREGEDGPPPPPVTPPMRP